MSDILRRLRFEFSAAEGEFRVTPPSYRFDIAIEEDLVEELARIHGYDRIPATTPAAPAVTAAGARSAARCGSAALDARRRATTRRS